MSNYSKLVNNINATPEAYKDMFVKAGYALNPETYEEYITLEEEAHGYEFNQPERLHLINALAQACADNRLSNVWTISGIRLSNQQATALTSEPNLVS